MHTSYITRPAYLFTMLCLCLLFSSNRCYADTPNILASIKPLHSIISHITEGISKTELLLGQQQSPHHFQLRPSQKRLINQADIFIYSSDNIEGFVPGLKNTTNHLLFIQLAEIPGIKSLPVRSFHSHDEHDHGHIDGHIWLSLENVIHFSRYISEKLGKLDPANAARYKNNLNNLLIKINKLRNDNLDLLQDIRDKSFLVYHDAFQYFENENKLTGAHFVTTSPEHTPGIKRVKELRQLIRSENIQCVFYEPPNIPSLLTTLTENKHIKLTALDPSGSQIGKGKQHYFELMHKTAQSLYDCLN